MDVRAHPVARRLHAIYARHPVIVSAAGTIAVGAALLALGITGLWQNYAIFGPDTALAWHVLILAAAFPVLLLRRRHPIVALGAGTILFTADILLGGTLGMLIVLFDLIYAAAYWAGPRARRMLLGIIAGLVAISFALPVVLGEPVQIVVLFGLQNFAILATPYWWAAAVRQGRELAASEAARADDAQRIAALDRQQAIRDERSRMAQDLHDAIAGDLSAIAIHSEAALSRSPDPARDRAALVAVRAASVEGLEQMRSMIALLRTGDDSPGAPLRLADLPAIVAASEAPVSLVGETPELPTAADQALARIIAESLRNAARHAPGSQVVISFAVDAEAHRVQVRSTGGRPADPAAAGTGHGIHLMRERAERVGGRLEAGPDGDGWLVTVRMPGGAGAAPAGRTPESRGERPEPHGGRPEPHGGRPEPHGGRPEPHGDAGQTPRSHGDAGMPEGAA
ncbi:sensor histidine kinase [Agromyces archimandritae]|uniref:histidine kinase n=1 Tax=Agromyces archimandritae TaxID=2781962 RepID=A0A975FKA6_9MICO|nr:histidine kinase [Agromyces archimandritae]QTX03639.1 hypothetical protein G127AT_09830 [Agromyces archimandritae]